MVSFKVLARSNIKTEIITKAALDKIKSMVVESTIIKMEISMMVSFKMISKMQLSAISNLLVGQSTGEE
jgi:hypothetical protein